MTVSIPPQIQRLLKGFLRLAGLAGFIILQRKETVAQLNSDANTSTVTEAHSETKYLLRVEVNDTSNTPVAYARIRVRSVDKSFQKEFLTGPDGKCTIQLSESVINDRQVSLEIDCMGFKTQRLEALPLDRAQRNLGVRLTPDAIVLQHITVPERAYTMMGMVLQRVPITKEHFETTSAEHPIEIREETDLNPPAPKFSIYPLPSTGLFWIESEDPENNFCVEIFDSSGKMLIKKDQLYARKQFDLLDQAPGLYFARIRSGKTEEVKKIIITK